MLWPNRLVMIRVLLNVETNLALCLSQKPNMSKKIQIKITYIRKNQTMEGEFDRNIYAKCKISSKK